MTCFLVRTKNKTKLIASSVKYKAAEIEASSMTTVNDLASKFRAKSELTNVLSREGSFYLPPKRDVTRNISEAFAERKAICKIKRS